MQRDRLFEMKEILMVWCRVNMVNLQQTAEDFQLLYDNISHPGFSSGANHDRSSIPTFVTSASPVPRAVPEGAVDATSTAKEPIQAVVPPPAAAVEEEEPEPQQDGEAVPPEPAMAPSFSDEVSV